MLFEWDFLVFVAAFSVAAFSPGPGLADGARRRGGLDRHQIIYLYQDEDLDITTPLLFAFTVMPFICTPGRLEKLSSIN